MPAMNEQYTINYEPQGDHLAVSIPELGITVSTAAGETSRDAATRAGLAAITEHLEATRKERRPRKHTRASRASA